MELSAYLAVLRRHWLVFVLTASLVLAAAAILTFTATPKYEATAQLFLKTPGGKDQSALQNGQFAIQRVRSYAVLEIPEVADEVQRELGLDKSPEAVAASVTVTAATDAAVLDVTATDTSRERARDVAEAYANSFSEHVAELETRDSNASLTQVGSPVASRGAVSPNVPLNLGAALVLGLLLGAAVASLVDLVRGSVERRSPHIAADDEPDARPAEA